MTSLTDCQACGFPITVKRFPQLPVPHRFLFISRHFGTGVLIATAFVHLLPTAFVSLTDPCLPSFWNETYPAMPGFIAMLSVMAVVSVEMFFATRGAGHSHSHDMDYSKVSISRRGSTNGYAGGDINAQPPRFKPYRQGELGSPELAQKPKGERGPSGGNSYFAHKPDDQTGSLPLETTPFYEEAGSDSDLELDELDDPAGPAASKRNAARGDAQRDIEPAWTQAQHSSTSLPPSIDEVHEQQKMLLQCMLLEAGILFHSIFIGMALSVATGAAFVVLLVAISFHQTFEGLALGSRIAAITAFGPRSPKPWLMALAYGTTTPVGQAIGLVLHNLYDPHSQTGLIMVGVTNAISSGLLLFAGLVELLAEDFLSDKSYETLKGWQRIEAWAAVFAGAMLMAFVGAWA